MKNRLFLIYLHPSMAFRIRNLFYLFVCLALLGSCNGYERVRKSSDVNYKLTKANEYYDKKHYQHANELYRDLMPIMKSTRNYEAMFYKYAYSYYYLKDYLDASYFFKNFAEYFPSSSYTEEAEFMSAVSLFKYAPKYTLDQTNTMKALEAMQSFVNTYPQSKRLTEANNYIDESRKKLELKQAGAAKLYYNISQFKAASVAYKSVMRNFPESPNSDLYQYMIMRSMFKYAEASVPGKQEERYTSAMSAYTELKDSYPSSKYLPEADKLYTVANNNVKKIRDEQHQ